MAHIMIMKATLEGTSDGTFRCHRARTSHAIANQTTPHHIRANHMTTNIPDDEVDIKAWDAPRELGEAGDGLGDVDVLGVQHRAGHLVPGG